MVPARPSPTHCSNRPASRAAASCGSATMPASEKPELRASARIWSRFGRRGGSTETGAEGNTEPGALLFAYCTMCPIANAGNETEHQGPPAGRAETHYPYCLQHIPFGRLWQTECKFSGGKIED